MVVSCIPQFHDWYTYNLHSLQVTLLTTGNSKERRKFHEMVSLWKSELWKPSIDQFGKKLRCLGQRIHHFTPNFLRFKSKIFQTFTLFHYQNLIYLYHSFPFLIICMSYHHQSCYFLIILNLFHTTFYSTYTSILHVKHLKYMRNVKSASFSQDLRWRFPQMRINIRLWYALVCALVKTFTRAKYLV